MMKLPKSVGKRFRELLYFRCLKVKISCGAFERTWEKEVMEMWVRLDERKEKVGEERKNFEVQEK